MIIILFVTFITAALCIVDPPSPGKIPELINNPYLDPEVFQQYKDFDYTTVLSEDLPSESHDHNESLKPRKRTKYANREEAREARLKRSRESNRTWRTKLKSLPDGSQIKETKKRKDREYERKRYDYIKSLPDGHEKKEAKRLTKLLSQRKRREMFKNLPDDDPRKQRQRKAQLQAQKRHKLKKSAEDPGFFRKERRERLERKKKAKQANS